MQLPLHKSWPMLLHANMKTITKALQALMARPSYHKAVQSQTGLLDCKHAHKPSSQPSVYLMRRQLSALGHKPHHVLVRNEVMHEIGKEALPSSI